MISTRRPAMISAIPVALALAFSCPLPAATLGGAAQSVMPQNTRQVISINYHRLASDPSAQQVEDQLLPPEMKGLSELLIKGGIKPADDLNRLTFATFQGKDAVALIGVAEGNLSGLQLGRFFTKTPKTPVPPQYHGVDIYTSGALTFFVPDGSTLVFGSVNAVQTAIDTEQGAIPRIAQNDEMTNLIAGTQTTDVWSIVDAEGTRNMVHQLIGSSLGGMDPAMIDKHFSGARYTIAFSGDVELNLELITTDALSAAAISTGLSAAVALRQKQEVNPAAKAILGQVHVDAAGDHAFLMVSSSEASLVSLLHTDLLQTIVH